MGVVAERHDQRLGAEFADRLAGTIDGRLHFRAARTRSERQVEIEALARPVAALVVIAGIERIIVRRIGMDRDRQHIVTTIEDLLRAVAVMGIDVEDRDLAEVRAQALRRDRRVVDIAEA